MESAIIWILKDLLRHLGVNIVCISALKKNPNIFALNKNILQQHSYNYKHVQKHQYI